MGLNPQEDFVVRAVLELRDRVDTAVIRQRWRDTEGQPLADRCDDLFGGIGPNSRALLGMIREQFGDADV